MASKYYFYIIKQKGRDVIVPYMSCRSDQGTQVLNCWEHDRHNDGKRKLYCFDPTYTHFPVFTSYEDFKKDPLHYIGFKR